MSALIPNLRHLAAGYRSFYRQLHTMRDPSDFTSTPSRIDRLTELPDIAREEKDANTRAEATYPPMKIEDMDIETMRTIVRAQEGLPK